MLDISIAVDSAAAEELAARVRAVAGQDRRRVHNFMAAHVENLTREYLAVQGAESHKTAQGLGASPTGFLAKAAGTVQAAGVEDGVLLSVQRAGLSRAFRPYHLEPTGGKKLLTIAAAPEAYGKGAREFTGLKWRSFSPEDVAAGKSDKSGIVLGRPASQPGGFFHALFFGARHVDQKQDRDLLPADEDWLDVMSVAVDDCLQAAASDFNPSPK